MNSQLAKRTFGTDLSNAAQTELRLRLDAKAVKSTAHFQCFGFLAEREETICTLPPQVTPEMRAVLVDWLFDVAFGLNLSDRTVHLAVALVDKYINKSTEVTKSNFQLIGTTALMAASKMEEGGPYSVDTFSDVTEKTYSPDEIIQMEAQILHALQFRLLLPTSMDYLGVSAQNQNLSPRHFYLAQFILEKGLQFGKLGNLGEYAAAAVLLAKRVIGAAESSSSKSLVQKAAKILCQCFVDPSESLTALDRKFSSKSYQEVARIKVSRKK